MKLIKISERVYVNLNSIENIQKASDNLEDKYDYFITTTSGQRYAITAQKYYELINLYYKQ